MDGDEWRRSHGLEANIDTNLVVFLLEKFVQPLL